MRQEWRTNEGRMEEEWRRRGGGGRGRRRNYEMNFSIVIVVMGGRVIVCQLNQSKLPIITMGP